MHSPVEALAAFAAPRVALARAGITGLGAALPAHAIPSDTIAERLGVAPGWIERRTGIRSRRRAASGEKVSDLATRAAVAALADAEIDADNVDVVLVATLSADDLTPNAAPIVAHEIGATRAGAMDIGAACAGFVSAITVAAGLLESHRASTVLVIGAEVLSRHVDPDDRSTAGLFGDGAGAVVMGAGRGSQVGETVLGADGSAAPFLVAPRSTGLIQMNGHETFKRAVSTLARNASEAAFANGLDITDVDLFVLHQANGRILAAVAETLGVDPERVLDAIADVGNTSAASIPLALAAARERGLLHDGDRVLLGAVGAGFTWGATVVEWGGA